MLQILLTLVLIPFLFILSAAIFLAILKDLGWPEFWLAIFVYSVYRADRLFRERRERWREKNMTR